MTIHILEETRCEARQLEMTPIDETHIPVVKHCVINNESLVNAQREAVVAENGDVYVVVHVLL